MDEFYRFLTSRNSYFIPDKLQTKIKNTRLVLVGCGLNSNVAFNAVRVGFENFIFIDGDKVEASNLNRQPFTTDQVGKNKAVATNELVKAINPNIKSEVIQEYIGVVRVSDIVSLGDIIINTVDFNEVTYKINDEAAAQDKISIFPLNIGFGAVVLVFSKDSRRLQEMTNNKIIDSDIEFLLSLYKGVENYTLPKYIKQNMIGAVNYIRKNKVFPQNCVAASINAALINMIMIDYLSGKKIKLAPRPIFVDAREYIT